MGGGDPVSLSVRFAPSSFPMVMRTKRGQRVVILLTFIKKTQKTPDQELKLAKARAKEVE
jgi:phage-related protein